MIISEYYINFSRVELSESRKAAKVNMVMLFIKISDFSLRCYELKIFIVYLISV
jgi:hypothetical protein